MFYRHAIRALELAGKLITNYTSQLAKLLTKRRKGGETALTLMTSFG